MNFKNKKFILVLLGLLIAFAVVEYRILDTSALFPAYNKMWYLIFPPSNESECRYAVMAYPDRGRVGFEGGCQFDGKEYNTIY